MLNESIPFKANSETALEDTNLQLALTRAKGGFVNKRLKALEEVEDFEALKASAQQAKQKALQNWANNLETFESNVIRNGGQVHWAETANDLCDIVLNIANSVGARTITKGKSMVSEEADLNLFLEKQGIRSVETDLGEYIIQLAKEKPSHIIAPAVHKTRQQVAELFKQHHRENHQDHYSGDDIAALVQEARQVLRQKFLDADIGITGANLCIAETGSCMVVTNEGNGDLSATLPKVHIVTTSIEKLVCSPEDAAAVLRVLTRSATGQAITSFVSYFSGPKQQTDTDGPDQFHVVLLDNGRSELQHSRYREMLNCIKCGACMNHCPVYMSVGGHAYGWVYPGPMGSVLTPMLTELKLANQLPNASTLCGRCESVCPMDIPLPQLLRELRDDEHRQRINSANWRIGTKVFMWIAAQPEWYQRFSNLFLKLLSLLGRKNRLQWLPVLCSWFKHRDLPIESSETFQSQWQKRRVK